MDYKKALENYNKIVKDLDDKISERKDKVEKLKEEIKNIKEERKQEIKNGILSNTIKKFTKINTISDKKSDIEVLLCEIEALEELKGGDSKELMKAAKHLVESVDLEKERIIKEKEANKKEREELLKRAEELRIEIAMTDSKIRELISNTTFTMTDLIRTKCPEEYEKYFEKGLDVLTLVKKVVEE